MKRFSRRHTPTSAPEPVRAEVERAQMLIEEDFDSPRDKSLLEQLQKAAVGLGTRFPQ